uniref:Protein yippee-like n=1 Tax=Anopheles atroparvus TaxID=41427 RepID=A0AAG5D974_ANOAO
MGVIFIEHPGGLVLYACAACSTVFSKKDEQIGIRNRGRTFPVYLFNNVVNVTYSEIQNHDNSNVPSPSRLVKCKKCNTCLGFMYEYPHTNCKKYKKKHVIEIALISVLRGFHEV